MKYKKLINITVQCLNANIENIAVHYGTKVYNTISSLNPQKLSGLS